MKDIVFFENINHDNEINYGTKASRLAFLYNQKISVPNGSVISLSDSLNYVQIWEFLEEKIQKPYIIRSSFSVEDGKFLSFAGIFESIKDIQTKDEFLSAVKNGITNNTKLKTYAEKYNIDIVDLRHNFIIQEYKKPIISGVIFSSDSNNKNLVTIEFSDQSEGVTAGSGKIFNLVYDKKTKKIINGLGINILAVDIVLKLVDLSIQIQEMFDGPQDIEWVYDGEKIWIVQTRNITASLSEKGKSINKVTNVFINNDIRLIKKYFTESVEYTTPITSTLFKKLYSSDGALGIVIKKLFGSHKTFSGDQLIVDIMGRSYINESNEKNLFPFFFQKSYYDLIINFITSVKKYPLSIFKSLIELLHSIFLSTILKIKLFITYRNIIYKKESIIRYSPLEQLNKHNECKDIVDFLNFNLVPKLFMYGFYQNYLFFLLKDKIHNFVTNDEWSDFISVDNSNSEYIPDPANVYELSEKKDISASTVYRSKKSNYQIRQKIIERLSDIWEKQMITTLLEMYDMFSSLREMYHKELVSNFSRLHTVLSLMDRNYKLYNSIWFASIDDVIENKDLSVDTLFQRRRTFEADIKITLPSEINREAWEKFLIKEPTEFKQVYDAVVLSSFNSEGLCGTIYDVKLGKKIDILLVTNLDPALVTYFSKIKGIITTTGGELSHASILAREFQVPIFRVNTDIQVFNNKYVLLDSENKKINLK